MQNIYKTTTKREFLINFTLSYLSFFVVYILLYLFEGQVIDYYIPLKLISFFSCLVCTCYLSLHYKSWIDWIEKSKHSNSIKQTVSFCWNLLLTIYISLLLIGSDNNKMIFIIIFFLLLFTLFNTSLIHTIPVNYNGVIFRNKYKYIFYAVMTWIAFYFYHYWFRNLQTEIVINPHKYFEDLTKYSDTYQVLYLFENFYHNITNGKNILYGNDFYILNTSHFYAFWQFPFTIVYSLFRIVLSSVTSYNLTSIVVILSSLLTSNFFFRKYFNYYLAGIASVLYISFPYFLGQLSIGHIGSFYYCFFPILLYYLDNSKLFSSNNIIIISITFLLISTTDWHLSYFIILLFLIYSIVKYRFILNNLRIINKRSFTIALIIFLLSILYIFYVKDTNISDVSTVEKTIRQTYKYNPEIYDLFIKNTLTEIGSTEKLIFIGPMFFFFLIGLIRNFKDNLFFSFSSIFFIFSSLGTKIYPSIYSIFFDYFPYFNFNRSPSRFFLIAIIFIIYFIIKGIILLFQNKNYTWIAICFVLSVYLLIIPVNRFNLLEFCKNLKTIDNQNQDVLLVLPLLSVNNYHNSSYLNVFTCTNKSLINGYTGSITKEIEPIYSNLLNINHQISFEHLNYLKNNNVKYIIVFKNSQELDYINWKVVLPSEDYLSVISDDDQMVIYQLN